MILPNMRGKLNPLFIIERRDQFSYHLIIFFIFYFNNIFIYLYLLNIIGFNCVKYIFVISYFSKLNSQMLS